MSLSGFNMNIWISSFISGIDWIKALYLSTDVCNSFIKDISGGLSLGQVQETHVNQSGPSLHKAYCLQVPIWSCLGSPSCREKAQLGRASEEDMLGFPVRNSQADLLHACPEMVVQEYGTGARHGHCM